MLHYILLSSSKIRWRTGWFEAGSLSIHPSAPSPSSFCRGYGSSNCFPEKKGQINHRPEFLQKELYILWRESSSRWVDCREDMGLFSYVYMSLEYLFVFICLFPHVYLPLFDLYTCLFPCFICLISYVHMSRFTRFGTFKSRAYSCMLWKSWTER